MNRWDAEETLRLIHEHKATHTHMVATMFHRLLGLPDEIKERYDLSFRQVQRFLAQEGTSEELADEYGDKVKFTKLNVDFNPQTSARYGVRSIPTLLIFKDGAPVDQVVGAVPKSVLHQRLEKALA